MHESVRQYRLYLVDGGQHIGKALDIEGASDKEAIEIAASILAEQSHYSRVEVWEGSRRVSTYPLPASEKSEPRLAVADEGAYDRFVATYRSSTAAPGFSRYRSTLAAKPLDGETGDQPNSLHAKIADRFGVLPNFFCAAGPPPVVVEELWNFALSAYLNNPLPPLFKERLFVFLSRFCVVRYCVVRHFGFLVGLGRPAGDATARPQSIEDIVSLLERPTPDAGNVDKAVSRLLVHSSAPAIPEPGTPFEAALFDTLVLLFLTPLASPRIREAVRGAIGATAFEYVIVLLSFIRMAHYWTETHPEIDYEPDMLQLMERHENLAQLLLEARN